MTLRSVDVGNFNLLARTRHDPVIGPRLLEEETMPAWTLPFGPRGDEHDRRGLSFSVRPGHGLKAIARFRF